VSGRSKKKQAGKPSPPQRASERTDSAPRPPDRTTKKKAKRFVKDVERMLKKHRAKIADKDAEKLTAALGDVRSALEGSPDAKRLSTALKDLDHKTEQILGFAKKSTAREYTESILIAILIAVILRAFVVEAFKIPTGSMIPTLEVGDHIFVNKFIYGLRVPFTNMWFVEWGIPERGDVIVFRYPLDLSKDYIKRVVAVAGDKVRVEGHDVYVNDRRLERRELERYTYVEEGEDVARFGDGPAKVNFAFAETSQETGNEYTVIYDHEFQRGSRFPAREDLPGLTCTRDTTVRRGECVVDDGFVFVMGDNRDNSSDSRVWGGVPTAYVKGKAMFVWWSHGPRSGVRWGRFGHVVQ
jgi:signal peptidase I